MKSWKTTLVGAVVGLIPLGQGVLQGLGQGQHFNWTEILTGAGIMVLGSVAKDFNVSGQQQQPPK